MATPKQVELRRSEKANSRHEFSWFITPSSDHMPVFSAPQAGDLGLQACLSWLASHGYRQLSESYPDSEIYVRRAQQ